MKKKIIVLASAVAVTVIMATTALAAPGYGYGCGGGSAVRICYSLMMDQNGNILDKTTFEANLDKAIQAGQLREEDRGFFVERYDYCAENAGSCGNYRGGGCGLGRGMGRVN